MPSPDFKHPRSSVSPLKWSKAKQMLAMLLGASLLLSGCDSAQNSGSDEPKLEILDDRVILDSSYIHTSNPERYQPSYNLEGALIPVELFKIEIPYATENLTLLVEEGASVKKGQILATLDTQIDPNQVRYMNHEFIDILIDGKKHVVENPITLAMQNAKNSLKAKTESSNKSDGSPTTPVSQEVDSNSSVESTKASSDQNSDSNNRAAVSSAAATEVTESTAPEQLMPATLVFKSPIAGRVTNMNADIKAAIAAKTAKLTQETAGSSDNKKSDDEKMQTAVSEVERRSINQHLDAGTSLMTIGDISRLQLIGKLPLSTLSQLAVGRPVNFTVFDVKTEFTGQISHITPDIEKGYLIVRAPLIVGEENPDALEPGMRASMSIDYGQIELGVRLPKTALHEADLSQLSTKHPRPTKLIKAFVWVIEQDHRLSYTPVEVVQYFADSDKYLVHGINNDSLIALADLPKNADGKLVSVD